MDCEIPLGHTVTQVNGDVYLIGGIDLATQHVLKFNCKFDKKAKKFKALEKM